MKISAFDWDEQNIDHIARHGVNPEEVEETCYNRPLILKGKQLRYLVYGQTDDGRYLLVVSAYLGKGIFRILTARDMAEAERRLYQRRR